MPTNSPLVISGAMLIDGTGRPAVSDAVVVVQGNRIDAVGSGDEVTAPDGARQIDALGRTLIPGMVDCHVHAYTSGFVPAPPPGDELAYAGIVAANNLRCALQLGITTVRDVSSGHVGIAARSAIEEGQWLGPRCYMSGRGICMTGGHGSGGGGIGIGVHEVDGPGAIRVAIRQERKAGAQLIKVLTSHRSEYPEFTQHELEVLVEEAHRFGMRVAAHAANYVTTRMATEAGVDTIEHGIEIAPETAALMAQKGTTLVSTCWVLHDIYEETCALKAKYEQIGEYASHPHRRWMEETIQVYEVLLERLPASMAAAREAGVRIAAGTDNVRASAPFAPLAREAPYLVRYGLSPMEAIESLTRCGAEAIGVEDQVGTIEPGKLADLVLLDGDPLLDVGALEKVCWVMKDGMEIPLHPEWQLRAVRDPMSP